MTSSAYSFLLDGGGSKTTAALLTSAGIELASCRVGPANLYREPAAGLAEIRAAWIELCGRTGLDPDAAAAATTVSAGLAGASGSVQRHAFADAFAGFAGRRLSSDGYIAFLGVFGDAPGALLSIGTGVVAFRRAVGQRPEIRAGWGFPTGDRGGGAWLGFRLAAEYLDHLDGIGERGPLWAVAEAAVGSSRDSILLWLARARAAEFAALAPAIVTNAGAGDPLASALLAEGADHVARLAGAVVAGTGGALCLAGGLAEVYRPLLEGRVAAPILPTARAPDPLRGAWLVAIGAAAPEYADVG